MSKVCRRLYRQSKGKTTALWAVAARLGRGFRLCVIQFVKGETGQWGRSKLPASWASSGTDGRWLYLLSKDMDETITKAGRWHLLRKDLSQAYDDPAGRVHLSLYFGWLETAK